MEGEPANALHGLDRFNEGQVLRSLINPAQQRPWLPPQEPVMPDHLARIAPEEIAIELAIAAADTQ